MTKPQTQHTPMPKILVDNVSAYLRSERFVEAADVVQGLAAERDRLRVVNKDLLAALKNALARLDADDEHNPPDVGQMRAAIASAEERK